MTDEYLVHTKGFINVEADSKEEAEEKAREETYRRPDEHEVEGFSAENLDKVTEPHVQVQLMRSGNHRHNGDRGLMRSESALDLLYLTNRTLARDFVGQENGIDRQLLLTLSKHILAMYDWDEEQKEDLFQNIEAIRDKYDKEGVKSTLMERYKYEEEQEEANKHDK
jgi:hypothetical protein